MCLVRRIRYFDVAIVLINTIFLVFLLVKWFRWRNKVNRSKPLLFSLTCLIFTVTFVNVCRCLFAIVCPEQAFADQEIVLKVHVKHIHRLIDRIRSDLVF
jgi:hypothetical protein